MCCIIIFISCVVAYYDDVRDFSYKSRDIVVRLIGRYNTAGQSGMPLYILHVTQRE